jgi:hypothetical protein
MTAIAMVACLAVLAGVSYFFYCCAVTLSHWLRAKLEDRRSIHQKFA